MIDLVGPLNLRVRIKTTFENNNNNILFDFWTQNEIFSKMPHSMDIIILFFYII